MTRERCRICDREVETGPLCRFCAFGVQSEMDALPLPPERPEPRPPGPCRHERVYKLVTGSIACRDCSLENPPEEPEPERRAEPCRHPRAYRLVTGSTACVNCSLENPPGAVVISEVRRGISPPPARCGSQGVPSPPDTGPQHYGGARGDGVYTMRVYDFAPARLVPMRHRSGSGDNDWSDQLYRRGMLDAWYLYNGKAEL